MEAKWCQLSDTSSYCPLDHDLTPDHKAVISQIMNKLITSGELPSTASNLELPTYICDTAHVLHLFQNFQFPSPQHLIFTMAVQSLLNRTPSTDTLIRLAELVLTLNNFSFDSSHFLQTKGMAMGTRMGLSYACLSELEQFINFTNTFHRALKFTWAISDTSLPFLDFSISISISRNRLTTDIHFKPTDSHSYLDYTSSHTPFCKNAIPYSQFLRLRRICSQDEAFYSRISQYLPTLALSAVRRDHSFRDSLVCSTLPTNFSTTPGTFPCNGKRCNTCSYTFPLTSIQGPKQSFQIQKRFTCTSSNLIYCILPSV
eukprot:g30348.t1